MEVKMKNMLIRNATIDDADRIYHIECICFPAAEAASMNAIKERITVFPEGFLVGLIDDEIMGFINGASTSGLYLKDEFFQSMACHEPSGKTMMVYGLDVNPDWQRKGYAAQLMNEFISIAEKSAKERVILTCKQHLVHYYEKFGFALEGVSESEHGGAKWYDMVKKL